MPLESKILLVEDDRDQAELFVTALELFGCTVIPVETAEDALTQLAADRFNLLLVDWDLPGMKGDTLITRVKSLEYAMKTVLISNHDAVESAARACGADAWMRKIEGIPGLRRIVNDLLLHP